MKTWQWLTGMLCLISCSGCAAQLHNIKSSSALTPDNAQSIVVGHIKIPPARLKTAYTFKFKHLSTSKEFEYAIRSWGCPRGKDCTDQPFCLSLPPGDYAIVRMQIMQGAGISETKPDIRFTVKPAATVYIGKLVIGKPDIQHNYILWANGRINLTVEDDHDSAEVELAPSCPGVKEMSVSLMSTGLED